MLLFDLRADIVFLFGSVKSLLFSVLIIVLLTLLRPFFFVGLACLCCDRLRLPGARRGARTRMRLLAMLVLLLRFLLFLLIDHVVHGHHF